MVSLSQKAQTQWDMNLNPIPPSFSPNFGTATNDPINFFTNGLQRMTLTTNGSLKINALAGSSTRILQVDSSGKLRACGPNLFLGSGSKIGVGVFSPTTEIDVLGNARVSNSFGVGDKLFFGLQGTTTKGMIQYIPSVSGNPSVFKFGLGGSSTANPEPWDGGGHTGEDPQPDLDCSTGTISPGTPALVNLFNDNITIRRIGSVGGSPINLGLISIGHDGLNGYIETKGTNPTAAQAGDLWINKKCGRNVYVFDNGNTFGPTLSNVMSVSGRLNVSQYMQIGGGNSLNSFSNPNAMLFISATSSPMGLKILHGGGAESGIKIVEISQGDKAFSVFNGTSTQDGSERFSVLGNGFTKITTAANDALKIENATTAQTIFQVKNDGTTFVGEGATSVTSSKFVIAETSATNKAISIINNSNINNVTDVFNVFGDGHTEIRSSNTNALKIFNAVTGNEIYKVQNNGYTEISVYSPAGMPQPYAGVASGRALTIRDKTNNKDIFVVRSDGKVYAREIEISLVPTFADYVFAPNYKLMSIQQLKQFIEVNKHLPGFENGSFYENNGINVNTLLVKQQEKIEEMALYIISLEERLSKLENQK